MVEVVRLLIVVTSLAAELGLESLGLSRRGTMLSYLEACGIFLDQGLNACPLRWQANS